MQFTPSDKHPVWSDFCQIVKAFGKQWTVRWADGEIQHDVDSDILGLAVQPGEHIEIGEKVVQCDGYKGNKALFVDPKKKKKKKSAAAAVTPTKTQRPPAASLRRSPRRGKKKQLARKFRNDDGDDALAEALAVGVAKAYTAPKDPDNDTLNEQHLRVNAELAATFQAAELRKWAKCRYRKLSRKNASALSSAYSAEKKKDSGFAPAIPYTFVERTLKAYVALQPNAQKHPNAGSVLLGAVQNTMTQVRPKSAKARLLAGDAEALRDRILPLLRMMFPAVKRGTVTKSSGDSGDAYARMLIRKDTYTFSDMCKYEEIMKHDIAMEMRAGDERGFPVLREGERVPTGEDVYDANTAIPDYKVHAMKPHPEIPMCRYASLTNAIIFAKNHGESPVMVTLPLTLDPYPYPM